MNDYGVSEHDEIALEFRDSCKNHYDLGVYSESSISDESGDDSGESGADSNEIDYDFDDDSDENNSNHENTKKLPPDFIYTD